MKELIKKLVEAWGPSGFEHHVRALIEEEVKDLCDEMRVDAMGNLICRVGTKKDGGKRIMVAAHMDEIGLMVSHIDRLGYARVTNIGGIFPMNLMGNRVKFEDGTLGTVSIANEWGRKDMPSLNDAYIDISTGTDDDGKNINGKNIQVGDPMIFWRTLEERGSRLISKSMDDRIGCVVAIEAMKKLKASGGPHEVYFAFTVQEEVGTRGAKTSAYGVDPDFGIALDVTGTGDGIKTKFCNVTMGAGTAIKVRDSGLIVSPAVRDLMIDTAEKHNIPYQREVLTGGATDAAAMLTTRAGIPSGCISIPCRYVHSVSETVDINDVQGSVDLLAAILANPIDTF